MNIATSLPSGISLPSPRVTEVLGNVKPMNSVGRRVVSFVLCDAYNFSYVYYRWHNMVNNWKEEHSIMLYDAD